MKSTYEYGYGVEVGVTVCASGSCTHKTGCNVESSAANARRQNVAITFVVTVDSATSTVTLASVQSSAAAATPSSLTSNIQSAASTTGTTVTVTVQSIAAPTTTQSQASQSSSSDDNTGVIVGAVVGGVAGAGLIGGGIAFFVMKSKSAAMVNPTAPAEQTAVVAMK